MASTLKQLRERIQADLDLEDETFIIDSDINSWINEAIKKAEAEIHTLYEDYFLTEAEITLVTTNAAPTDTDDVEESWPNTQFYQYPSDIYANKIRKIVYVNDSNSSTHEVKRVKNLTAATERDVYDTASNPILEWAPYNGAWSYEYGDTPTTVSVPRVINILKAAETGYSPVTLAGKAIRIFPKAGRSGKLKIWYIRNANQLVADTDTCDIDEFERYVLQAVKTECFFKDGDPRAIQSKQLEEQLKQDMINTLSNMVPDNNTEIPMDFSFYDDVGE